MVNEMMSEAPVFFFLMVSLPRTMRFGSLSNHLFHIAVLWESLDSSTRIGIEERIGNDFTVAS